MNTNQLTERAYLWTRILAAPFWAVYNLLPFILYKDLGATPFQLALVIVLKPLVSILSIYWSEAMARRPERLVRNIVWSTILGHLPFLFCPFFDSPWFFIAIFSFYMMLARGIMPAWMEILKNNLSKSARERVYASGSSFGYGGNIFLGILFALFLDGYHEAWRWMFPFGALLSFFAVLFQLRIPIDSKAFPASTERVKILKPWISAWRLMRDRKDYMLFQVGFMLGGGGLMVMFPALPAFFCDTLNLSYTEMSIARNLCTGVGFVATTHLWASWMNRVNIFRFTSLVTCFAGVFPILLYFSQVNLYWLYAAYLIYGVMQAGSELSWHLSGPLFAQKEDSIGYSNVNILTVGVRGAFVPPIGSFLCAFTDPTYTLFLGSFLCFVAAERLLAYSRLPHHARA